MPAQNVTMSSRPSMLSRVWLHAARVADAILFWPLLLLVIWGQLTAAEEILFEHISDKVLHFGAYFALAAMAAAAFRGRGPVIWAVLGLIVLGGGLEIVQSMVGRDASPWDEAANTAGALTGGVGARVVVERLRRLFEAGGR